MSETKNLVPEGRYRARVVEHDVGKTSKGNPQVAVGFVFTDTEGKERRITAYIVFTEDSMAAEKGCCHTLRQLGWDPEKENWRTEQLGAKTDLNPDGGVLVDREVDITIEHEEYEGKTRARVAWINQIGGLAMKDRAETPEELGAIGDLIRSMAKGEGAPKPSTGASKKPSGSGKSSSNSKPAAKSSGVPF